MCPAQWQVRLALQDGDLAEAQTISQTVHPPNGSQPAPTQTWGGRNTQTTKFQKKMLYLYRSFKH